MEKKYSQFRNISIKTDLPIFFVKNSADNIDKYFEKQGIETLEDLLSAYDRGKFNDNRFKFNKEIKGQTKLLRYYYTGVPFGTVEILNKKLPMDDKDSLYEWFFNSGKSEGLISIGITETEQHMLYNYCRSYLKDYNGTSASSIIEMMKELVSDRIYLNNLMKNAIFDWEIKTIRNLMFKAGFFRTYISDMDLVTKGRINDDHLITIADVGTTSDLREQLNMLQAQKERIEKQMDYVNSQIENINNAVQIRKERNKVLVKK